MGLPASIRIDSLHTLFLCTFEALLESRAFNCIMCTAHEMITYHIFAKSIKE